MCSRDARNTELSTPYIMRYKFITKKILNIIWIDVDSCKGNENEKIRHLEYTRWFKSYVNKKMKYHHAVNYKNIHIF